MEQFEFEWEDGVRMHRITPKWVMKLAIWSVIVAYLPNIIWYFAGYPADAIFMQLLVITIGMPPVIFLAMRAYRKHYGTMRLKGSMWMKGTDIVITKTILTETFHRYIEVWKSGMPLIEDIILDKESGRMSIRAMLHVEAYTRKRDGSRGNLVAADSLTRSVDVTVPAEKMDGLMEMLDRYYSEVLTIKGKGDLKDVKEI